MSEQNIKYVVEPEQLTAIGNEVRRLLEIQVEEGENPVEKCPVTIDNLVSASSGTIGKIEEGYEKGKVEGGDTTEILDIFITSLKEKGYNANNKGDFSDVFSSSPINDELLLEVMKRIDNSAILLAYRIFYGAKNIRDALYTGSWDFSQCQSLNSAFASSTVQKIKKVDARNTISGHNGMINMFHSCKQLESIDEFYPSTGTKKTGFTNTFFQCTALTHIIFMSEISQNGLNVQWSDLDVESLKSILDNLADKSKDTSGTTWKVIVGGTNYAKIEEHLSTELNNAYKKGWAIE